MTQHQLAVMTQHRYYEILGDDLAVVPFLRAVARLRSLRSGFAPVAKSIASAAQSIAPALHRLRQRPHSLRRVRLRGFSLSEPLSNLASQVLERHENSGFSTSENPSNIRDVACAARLLPLAKTLARLDGHCHRFGLHAASELGEAREYLPQYGFCRPENGITVDAADNYVWFCRLKNCEYALWVKMP